MTVLALAFLAAIAGPVALRLLAPRTRTTSRPEWTACLLALAMVAVTVATLGALATIVWPLAARLGLVAEIGHFSNDLVDRAVPVSAWVSGAAAALGVVVLLRVARVFTGELRLLRQWSREGSREPLVVLQDPVPFAHAIYGWGIRPGRVVVSSGLLADLEPDERAAVLAHERTHLRSHHAVFALVGALGVAVNPLLRPSREQLSFHLERWADESAARSTSRSTTAEAVGRTALARARYPSFGAHALGLGGSAVPARVEALFDPPRDNRWRDLGVYLTIAGATTVLLVVALAYAESLLDILQGLS